MAMDISANNKVFIAFQNNDDSRPIIEAILEDAEIVAPAPAGEVGLGTIVTIVYDGDDDDAAERYLIGHMEELRTTARARVEEMFRSVPRWADLSHIPIEHWEAEFIDGRGGSLNVSHGE